MVLRGNRRSSDLAPRPVHLTRAYSASELEQLAAIITRARRAGLDPARVLAALAVPPGVVSALVQRADP